MPRLFWKDGQGQRRGLVLLLGSNCVFTPPRTQMRRPCAHSSRPHQTSPLTKAAFINVPCVT